MIWLFLAFFRGASPCEWTYDEARGDGPSNWGRVCDGVFPACDPTRGLFQSPIDLLLPQEQGQTFATSLPSLTSQWASQPDEDAWFTVRKPGQVFVISKEKKEIFSTYLQGPELPSPEPYSLIQLHLHMPAEHHLGGRTFPLEMHLVHRAPPGLSRAVDGQAEWVTVALLFEEQEPQNDETILARLLHASSGGFHKFKFSLPGLYKWANGEGRSGGPRDRAVDSTQSFYGYKGSQTKPPCLEKVYWLVGKIPLPASRRQLQEFALFVTNNSRPLQPLNGRKVGLSHLAELLHPAGPTLPAAARADGHAVTDEYSSTGQTGTNSLNDTKQRLQVEPHFWCFNVSREGFFIRLSVPFIAILLSIRSWSRGTTAMPDPVFCWRWLDCSTLAVMLGGPAGQGLPTRERGPGHGSTGKSKYTPSRVEPPNTRTNESDSQIRTGRKLGFVHEQALQLTPVGRVVQGQTNHV
eukprot:g64672.t1